jgi:c-di-GMP-binding flagellar brake protein YcgR
MASFVDLRPGTRLTLLPDTAGRRRAYDAVVRHVSEHGVRLDAAHPEHEPLEVEPGDEVTLVLQLHGRMYTLSTRVKLIERSPVEVIVVDRPETAERAERRSFYRLMTSIAPRYTAWVDEDGDEIEGLRAQITDVSGGGVQLRSKDAVPVGDRVRLIFRFDGESRELDVSAIAMSTEAIGPRGGQYRVNAKFVGLSDLEQAYLIQQIHREQRELRQRGVV